jgi:hypothetical protein
MVRKYMCFKGEDRGVFDGNIPNIRCKIHVEALTTNVRKAKQFWPVRSF